MADPRPRSAMEDGGLALVAAAVSEHGVRKLFGMFSGGHDSLCSTAIAAQHPAFVAAVHINTGFGIDETRAFVRETCQREGWPLIEMHPDKRTYEEMVLERGFPSGPKSHNTMYYWLKQRQMRRLVAKHKTHRHDRIGLVSGIRVSESLRRRNSAIAVGAQRVGAQVWMQPILNWTALDCGDYIAFRGFARNQVSDYLHRSGECLCGALAQPSELAEIALWYPAMGKRIRDLEAACEAKGLKACRWATRVKPKPKADQWTDLPLCTRCVLAGSDG